MLTEISGMVGEMVKWWNGGMVEWWIGGMAFSDLQRERNGSSLRQNYFIILSLKEAQQFRLQNKANAIPQFTALVSTRAFLVFHYTGPT